MMPDGATVVFLRTDAGVFDPRIQKESVTLLHAGYKVEVFGWDRRSEFERTEVIGGVRYTRTRIPAPYGSNTLAFFLPFFWIRSLFFLARQRPACVHACDLDALIPALIVKFFLHVRVIYDIFDNFADKIGGVPGIVRRAIRRLDGFLMKFSDAVIVTDDYRKSLLPKTMRQRIEVVMNVPPHVASLDSRLPGDDIIRLCYAGVIHEHRGLRLVADATRTMSGIRVQFAGWVPRPQDLEYLQSQPHLEYLGKLSYSDSLALLHRSDIVLALYDPGLPINAMASSNKIFEAMSVSRPVITNRETTMAEIVREEDCGCLVTYGDITDLRKNLERLKTDHGYRTALGRNGYRAFMEKYNWGIMEGRLRKVYANL